MGVSDESFLPQIVGLFYATFDPTAGPIILHQVPDNLISSSSDDSRSRSRSVSRSRPPASPIPSPSPNSAAARSPTTTLSRSLREDDARLSSNGDSDRERDRGRGRGRDRDRDAETSTRGRSRSRYLHNPYNRSDHSSPSRSNAMTTNLSASQSNSHGPGPSHYSRSLLDFASISEYIIPKKSLHGKLVTFLATGDDDERYRVMGFPSVLEGEGDRYLRNEYMWNLCFVFSAESSLEAFEPVVRKSARILRSAEIDSGYLSSPKPQHTSLPAVLEQIFEDLNSYSETSIPLDGFNSLELKLFPFFPNLFLDDSANPPDCHDWDVPIALVDLNDLKDDNWDITAARVSQYINGINHVRRIAELADADPALTRETLRHMLYYQVVMMIDIFQYSNIYTLEPSFKRLASDESVIRECGDYVTRPGFDPPSWPVLCGLYARLHPGTTVHDWIESNDILSLGVDPRRFTSFGVIKGFLRRVHRWPVVVDKTAPVPILFDQPEHRHSLHHTHSGASGAGAGAGGRRKVGFRRNDSSNALSSSRGDSAFSSRPTLAHNHSGLTAAGSLFSGNAGSSGVQALGSSHALAGESAFTLRSVDSGNSLGVSPSSGANRTPPSNPNRSPGPSFSHISRRGNGGVNGHVGGGGGGGVGGGGVGSTPPLTTRDSTGRSLNSAGDTLPSVSSRRGGSAVGLGIGMGVGANGSGGGGGGGGGSGFTRAPMSGRTSGMLTVSTHLGGGGGGSGFGLGLGHGAGTGGGGQGSGLGLGLALGPDPEYYRLAIEDEMVRLLDGKHNADEIQVRFGIGWGELEKVVGVDDRGGVGRKGIAVVYR